MPLNSSPWHDWPSNFSHGGITNKSVDGIGTFFQYTNEAVGGAFGAMILFIVAIAIFVIQGSNSEKRAVVSLFITSFIATMMMMAELVSLPIIMMLWIGTAITILATKNSTDAGRL